VVAEERLGEPVNSRDCFWTIGGAKDLEAMIEVC
jgi:hypothetical protein